MPQVVMPGPARAPRALAAALALALCVSPAAARGESVVRQHLDAGRVQVTGMDINGDGIADSIRLDRIRGGLAYFVGDGRKNLVGFDPSSLPEADRRFVPDILVERDLDGDEIEDLLLCNRDYLARYAAETPVFLRILAGCVYIGQRGGTFRDLATAAPSPEARAAILDRARRLVRLGH